MVKVTQVRISNLQMKPQRLICYASIVLEEEFKVVEIRVEKRFNKEFSMLTSENITSDAILLTMPGIPSKPIYNSEDSSNIKNSRKLQGSCSLCFPVTKRLYSEIAEAVASEIRRSACQQKEK